MRRVLGLALALLPTLAPGQTGFAYLPFKMMSSAAQPFPYYVDSRISAPAGLALAQVQTAVTGAWTSWNNVGCARPKTTFVNTTTTAGISNPADVYDTYSVMAVWATATSDTHYQQYLYGIPDIAAAAVPIGFNGVLDTCDVFLNAVNKSWSVTLPVPSTSMDLQTALIHEFGHCLGLDHHVITADDVMYPAIPAGVALRTPSSADTQSLCNRYPLTGAQGAPCLADGGCGVAPDAGMKCITQNVSGTNKSFCTVGCQDGTGFQCDVPLLCGASTTFNPGFSGACLLPDSSTTKVGMACTSDPQCGSSAALCQQPFVGASGTTFWRDGYCMQKCGGANPPCPSGSLCTAFAGQPDTYCLHQCRVGLADCRPGYSCAQTTQGGVCIPECRTDTDCGDPSAFLCRTCDGLCVDKQTPAAQVGDICTTDAQCGPGQICLQLTTNSQLKMCTQSCARGCGVCPSGSSCHPLGQFQQLYCLRNCDYGTCPAGEQCATLSTGRGCMPACARTTDCPVAFECNFGECRPFGSTVDAGCDPFCPTTDSGIPITPRPDAGTGGGGGSAGCGCGAGPGQALPLAFLAWALARGLSRRRACRDR